jgi:hypothetical protein
LAEQIGSPGIRVSYSGGGISADAVIADVLGADSAARRLLVVSSDREIARAAKRRRARPIRSEEFWARVQRDLARPNSERVEPREKETGLSPSAADEWLEEFGLS